MMREGVTADDGMKWYPFIELISVASLLLFLIDNNLESCLIQKLKCVYILVFCTVLVICNFVILFFFFTINVLHLLF
jgi:hypothetical protein